LAVAGQLVSPDERGRYGESTRLAVEGFQRARGLEATGECDATTWAALVESGFQLGDRTLYLRQPMLRGGDVSELQHRLGVLGFDAGRVDGIFGPDTARAVTDFQRNAGLPGDGVCGRVTIEALARLGMTVPQNGQCVATIREVEELLDLPKTLLNRRIAVGQRGGLSAVTRAVSRELKTHGAVVLQVDDLDDTAQARAANRFEAGVYLGLAVGSGTSANAISYYEAPGFVSYGGRRLAELIHAEISGVLPTPPPTGMQMAILRETKMPAVLCQLGPLPAVLRRSHELSVALHSALSRWVEEPVAG